MSSLNNSHSESPFPNSHAKTPLVLTVNQNQNRRPQHLKTLHAYHSFSDLHPELSENYQLHQTHHETRHFTQKQNVPVSDTLDASHRFVKDKKTYSPVLAPTHQHQNFYSPMQEPHRHNSKKTLNPSSFKLNLLRKNTKKTLINENETNNNETFLPKRHDSRAFTTPPTDLKPFLEQLHLEKQFDQSGSPNSSEEKSMHFDQSLNHSQSKKLSKEINLFKKSPANEKKKMLKWNSTITDDFREQHLNSNSISQSFNEQHSPKELKKDSFSTFHKHSRSRNKSSHELKSNDTAQTQGTASSYAHKGQSLNKKNNLNQNTRCFSPKIARSKSQRRVSIQKASNEKKKNESEQKKVYTPYRNLDIRDFQIGELLGRGGQATARMALHKETGAVFCLRIIPRKRVMENLSKFIEALKIQMYLNHPNVAKVYGLIVEEDKVYMIMEYCPDGTLGDNLREINKKYSELHKVELLKILAEGVKYIHDEKIQHRDLKLENILMVEGVPKICDFELAVYVKLQFLKRKTICGSPVYFSPQMIANNRYNTKADIWCLGIIFYQILCGIFPFQLKGAMDFSEITQGNIKPFPEGFDPHAKELLLAMLEVDSDERLDAELVFEIPVSLDGAWDGEKMIFANTFIQVYATSLTERQLICGGPCGKKVRKGKTEV